MKEEFSSKEELFIRVKPALTAKETELHRLGFSYISKDDIWNYLVEIKWKKGKDLSLADIVSDILNVENKMIDEYLKGKIQKRRRTQYFDDEFIEEI